MFAEMYGKMSGKGKGRGKKSRPVALRAQTPGSVEHGGHTGHYAGPRRGPHAAMPHHGGHTGGTRPGHPMQGRGFQGGPHAASPHSGQLHRATGYKGVGGDYAAASPQPGFILNARGNFRGRGPGMR